MASKLALVSDNDRLDQAKRLTQQVIEAVSQVVLGKEHQIRLAFSCLLAGGHLLIEDVPGVGKTLLARSLAVTLGLDFRRIQFTSDMLPADITGISVYDPKSNGFEFHPGPVFAQIVLADEVNRATAKAQSSLLEAMEENQVTTDGKTYPLPVPFFVVATQNPTHQIGTFPLPESQLDRFLMRIELGYPAESVERELLRGGHRRDLLNNQVAVLSAPDILELQKIGQQIHVSDALLDYAQELVAATRNAPEIELGLSPRAAVDLILAAKCWAMIHGHPGIRPEDLKVVFPAAAAHRIRLRDDISRSTQGFIGAILDTVPVP